MRSYRFFSLNELFNSLEVCKIYKRQDTLFVLPPSRLLRYVKFHFKLHDKIWQGIFPSKRVNNFRSLQRKKKKKKRIDHHVGLRVPFLPFFRQIIFQ